MNSPASQPEQNPARIEKRLFFCRIILSVALTYFLILALLFLAGSVFSGKIIGAVSAYYSPEDGSPEIFRWFALAGTVLYFIASAGIILFTLNRRTGFYIFFTAAVIIFSLDLAFLDFDWLRYLIHSGFIFILGIAHFSGKCYNKGTSTDR